MSKNKNNAPEKPTKQTVYIKNSYTGPSMILIPPAPKPLKEASTTPKQQPKGK